MRNMIATIAAALFATTAPAAQARTLLLYDTSLSEGRRIAGSAFSDQEFARMTANGLAQPMRVPVDDAGATRTVVMDVVAPFPNLVATPGTLLRTGRVTWQVTTALAGGVLSWDAEVTRASVLTDGLRTVDPRTIRTRMRGASPEAARGPTIAHPYTSAAGERMLIGYLRP